MKRTFLVLLVIVLACSLFACTPAPSETSAPEDQQQKVTPTPVAEPGEVSFTPGTYSGTAVGRNGELTVAVTVDETSIVSIELTKHVETSGIAAASIADINQKVIKQQSLAVDATTGATITGYAILNAATKALEESGVNMDFLKTRAEKPAKAVGQEEEFDVIILGAGAGGLGASIELLRNNPELSVLLLEKAAYTGGDLGFSGGGVSVIGSKYNKEIGMDVDPKDIEAFFKMRSGEYADLLVPGLTYNAFSLWGEMFDYLIGQGLPLNTERGLVSWDLDATKNSFAATDDESGGTFELIPNTGSPKKMRNGILMFTHPTLSSPETSQALVASLTEMVVAGGVDLRLNSKGTELIVEDGAVTGVVIEDEEKTYNVKAKKVILATGGINNNPELIAKYMPKVEGAIVRGCSGATGDAILMTEKLNAVVNGQGQNGMSCIDIINAYDSSIGAVYGISGIWVNKNGERFCDEGGHIYNTSILVHQQPDHIAYNLFDVNSAPIDTLEEGLAKGIGFKADTLEGLAVAAGIDAEKLLATVEQYNADYVAGGDTIQGLTAEEMTPLQDGPFYAVPMKYLNLGIQVGLLSDDKCAIVNAEGATIPNLFGCGYVVIGNAYGNRSPASGLNLGTSFSTGALAARTAAAEIG